MKIIDQFAANQSILLFPNKSIKLGLVNFEIKKYKGVVWCPETEYGTWVCRNGGYTFITGNSYKADMVGDAILKMYTSQHLRPWP